MVDLFDVDQTPPELDSPRRSRRPLRVGRTVGVVCLAALVALVLWLIWHEMKDARRVRAADAVSETIAALPHVESGFAHASTGYLEAARSQEVFIRMLPDASREDIVAVYTAVAAAWEDSDLAGEWAYIGIVVDGPSWSGDFSLPGFTLREATLVRELALWELTAQELDAPVRWELSRGSYGERRLEREVSAELTAVTDGPDLLIDQLRQIRSFDGLEGVATDWSLTSLHDGTGGRYGDTFTADPGLPDDATLDLWRSLDAAIPGEIRAEAGVHFSAVAGYDTPVDFTLEITYDTTVLSDSPGDFSAGSIWGPTVAQLNLLGAQSQPFHLEIHGNGDTEITSMTLASNPDGCAVRPTWAAAQQAVLAQAAAPFC